MGTFEQILLFFHLGLPAHYVSPAIKQLAASDAPKHSRN